MRFAALSHTGNVRKHNEDAWYFSDREAPVAIVADGMGGHRAGEVASAMAIEAAVRRLSETDSAPQERVYRALETANAAVFQAARGDEALAGMGTTMILALFEGGEAHIGHVGDSRAYLWHDGVLTRITRDHSLMEEWLDAGYITPAEVENHPYRHVITRALGTQAWVEIDRRSLPFGPGDRLLLCSDGLNNEVLEEEMAQILAAEPDPEFCARRLIDAAIGKRGRDNVTVLIAAGEEGTP